jgi:putative methionine-R-sulfoxide reductase with GAF domain
MPTWTPSDFVLYGKLCDDRTLHRQLEKIRQTLQADTTILLVSRGRQFFRSMIVVADRDEGKADRLQSELITLCNDQSEQETRELPRRPYRGSLWEARVEFPQDAFHDGLLAHFLVGSIYLATFPDHPEDRAALLPTDEAPPSLLVVALSPSPLEGDVLSKSIEGRQPLACMVNASQAVRAHRWNYSTREVDRLLDECERMWEAELEKTAPGPTGQQDNDFERLLRYSGGLLLKLATKLTRSSIGQVFLTQSNARRLMVLASERFPCGEPEGPGGTPTIEIAKMEGIVSLAYERVRAVLINDIPEFLRSHPRVTYLRPKGAASESRAELAVPITQNTSGDDQGVLGILNVEKDGLDPGQYTTRDLDVCQHLARRFCRWRARIQHTIFARSLAQLTRKVALTSDSARRKPRPDQGILGRASDGPHQGSPSHIRWVDGEWYDDRVPSEFRQALRPVEEALKTAFELTRSHMVRVFLVTRDGSALVPFCDYPVVEGIHYTEPKEPARFLAKPSNGPVYDEGQEEAGGRIRLPVIKLARHARSISAWVARHGRPCFIGNFDAPDALKDYEGLESYLRTYDDTRSECCVPLFLSGRLIGTLNFQSYYLNVYREQRHLIEAIAELISLTFARERRAVEQGIFESRAVLAYQEHVLINKVEELKVLADQQSFPPDFCRKMTSVKEIIEKRSIEIVDHERSADSDRFSDRAIARLVREQVKRVMLRNIFEFDRTLDLACPGDEVPVDTVVPLMVAIQEVLKSAQQEASRVRGGKVCIGCKKRWLGGQAYAVIRVTNPCNDPGPGTYQNELYRQPFRKEEKDRPHLGAFIAGSWLRAFGGEMSFVFGPGPENRGFVATTQIEVTVQPRGQYEPVVRPVGGE